MDRKEFLKNACGLGVCGCALHFLGASGALGAQEAGAPDPKLAFARYSGGQDGRIHGRGRGQGGLRRDHREDRPRSAPG